MRTLLLPFCFFAGAAIAQQTIHSTGNGAATNPLTWDCTCFPTPDDFVYIDHQVTMNTDWAVTSGGKIEIASGASFLQDANRQLLIDGAGSLLVNKGAIAFMDIAFTNGAGGSNTGQFSIENGMYFGSGTTFANSGGISDADSVLTEGTFTNSGSFSAAKFYNTGDFTNTGYIVADSMGNGGTFDADANYLLIGVFANFGTFNMHNEGFLDVSGNFLNTGDFMIFGSPQAYIGGDAFNGDSIAGSANLLVDGAFVVTGDFGNSDNISGAGDICVGDESMNTGQVTGTLDFCDATGSNFDANFGTIGAGVTFCVSGCHLGVEETQAVAATLYPNPASAALKIASDQAFTSVQFFSVTGELVQTSDVNGTAIDIRGLEAGVYFVRLSGVAATELLRVVVE